MDFSGDDLANFSKAFEGAANFEEFSRAMRDLPEESSRAMRDLPASPEWDVILSASQRNDVSVATAHATDRANADERPQRCDLRR